MTKRGSPAGGGSRGVWEQRAARARPRTSPLRLLRSYFSLNSPVNTGTSALSLLSTQHF